MPSPPSSSVSVSSVSKKDALFSGVATTSKEQPLKYHPSVFRYTCRGRLTLDKFRNPHHAGVCRGMQSQLEHIDHWRVMGEDDAIQHFQAKAALMNDPEGTAPTAAGANHPGSAASAGTGHALQAVYMSNALIYPTAETPNSESSSNSNSERKTKNAYKKEDSKIDEEWSCHGTTQVDLLVLRPQDSKDERIAAVSPFCAPGMTTRDLTTKGSGRERTSTIRLGFVEILYQSSLEDEENDDDEDLNHEEDRRRNNNSRAASLHHQPEEGAPNLQGSVGKTKKKDSSSSQKELNNTTPTPMWKKVFNSSNKIVASMQLNAQLVAEATHEDFWGRSVAASERVADEMPRTIDRTLNLMRRVVTWDWSSPPDDDDGRRR